MELPGDVALILARLQNNGFEAYAVGGCVRDSLRGVPPHDWDICTAARPEAMLRIFAGETLIPTGLKHGTVTLVQHGIPYEITTYRIDGEYTDHRRPDSVQFSEDLRADLQRRDFTVNAMAYNPTHGLVDPFGGQMDLQRGIIRAVGDPDTRFTEDALRLLRALRFCARLDFDIEEQTALAIHRQRELLREIAPERIQAELRGLLCGKRIEWLLETFFDLFSILLYELSATRGFRQQNPNHAYDVWTHTRKTVGSTEPDFLLRMAALLHDIGKPLCFTKDENGIGHFYGHAQRGAEIAHRIMRRLRFPTAEMRAVEELVLYHDSIPEPNRTAVRRRLNKIGEVRLRQLLKLRRADVQAQAPAFLSERLSQIDRTEAVLEELVAQDACFSLRTLAVNGRDLIAIGVPPGPQLGSYLNRLLREVLEERLPNDRDTLLAHCKTFL